MKSKPKFEDQESDQPPRYLTLFVAWLIAPHLHEQVLGDLHERYARRLKVHGKASEKALLH